MCAHMLENRARFAYTFTLARCLPREAAAVRRSQARGMKRFVNYIVIDLEWNQKIHRGGSMRDIGEIIEIGAVKMDQNMQLCDELCIVVKPSVYSGLHPHVKKIVHLDEAALQEGVLFEDAARQLFDFCGEEYVFLSWGDEDAAILMQNLAYYGLPVDPAAKHYDMQRIYYQQLEEEKQNQRALCWCVEKLGIEEQSGEYHSALTDARYAAQILKHLDMQRAAAENTGLFLPTKKQQQSYYAKFRMLAQSGQGSPVCPVCRRATRCVADMFSFSGNSMIVVARCPQDGYFSAIFSRSRQKKRRGGARRKAHGAQ